MFIQIINLQVKEEFLEEFIKISLYHADKSLEEDGIIRFDVLRSSEDRTQFIFIEEFKSESDVQLHRQSEHFLKWQKNAPNYLLSKKKLVVSKLLA